MNWFKTLTATAILAAILVPSSQSLAGWSSGGGELIRDARNPWFLQNTKVVNYCVEIDEANFGLGRSRVEEIVRVTLANWKSEFAETRPSTPGTDGKELKVGTQVFQQVACAKGVSIVFQFGVLGGEQIQRIGDPKKYLGLTVRTDYDTKNMRGRGFIYISPSRGPLKYESTKVVDDVWSMEDGALLYAVLSHEVGHVFGMIHSSEYGLMSERFPETLVDKERAHYGAEMFKNFPRFHLFKFSDTIFSDVQMAMCSSTSDSSSNGPIVIEQNRKFFADNPQTNFFAVPADVECVSMRFKNNQFVVEVKKGKGPYKVWGKAELQRFDPPMAFDAALLVYLPDEQTLYPGASGLQSGPWMQAKTAFKGTYKTTDGKVSREMGLTALSTGSYQISGVINGKLLLNVHEGI